MAKNYMPVVRKLAGGIMRWLEAHPRANTCAKKVAEWHNVKMGYRKLGLLKDDIIPDEELVVKEALRRLPEAVLCARTFRQKRAVQLNLNHDILPEAEWVKREEVARAVRVRACYMCCATRTCATSCRSS